MPLSNPCRMVASKEVTPITRANLNMNLRGSTDSLRAAITLSPITASPHTWITTVNAISGRLHIQSLSHVPKPLGFICAPRDECTRRGRAHRSPGPRESDGPPPLALCSRSALLTQNSGTREQTQMRYFRMIVACAAIVAVAGCSKSNPLLGKWKLAPNQGNECFQLGEIEFGDQT